MLGLCWGYEKLAVIFAQIKAGVLSGSGHSDQREEGFDSERTLHSSGAKLNFDHDTSVTASRGARALVIWRVEIVNEYLAFNRPDLPL